MPNITGLIVPRGDGDRGAGGVLTASGAFFFTMPGSIRTAGNLVINAPSGAGFDASLSNSIYSNSETVTPLSYSTKFFIKY